MSDEQGRITIADARARLAEQKARIAELEVALTERTRERDDARDALRLANAALDQACDAQAERDAAIARAEAAKRDAERLDTLDRLCKRNGTIRVGVDFHSCVAWVVSSAKDNLRDALDNILAQEKGAP